MVFGSKGDSAYWMRTKKQLAEGRKHRGFVKVMPDNELAEEYVGKVEHKLEFFLLAMKHGFND